MIRGVLAILAGVCIAGPASPASAANLPFDPPAGKSFDTTEAYGFEVQHETGDPPRAIKLSPDADMNRWIAFPADDPDVFEVDMAWLVAKYNEVGLFTWSVCNLDPATEVLVEDTCSEPRPFNIRFRLSALDV